VPEEATKGRYLYCIICCDEPRTFTARGIGEEEDIDVYTIHHADLASVVSDSPVIDYERTRQNMMAHELVVGEVMRDFTVLPVRFGTVAPDEEAVREKMLKRRYDEFKGLMSEMEDRDEAGLKIFWREERLYQDIVDENPSIRQLRDRLAGKPLEQRHYESIHLGEMVKDAVIRKRDTEAQRVMDRLSPIACKSKTNNLLGDKMVLNAAFLVDRARAQEFDGAIQALDEELGEHLMFKYVGPVAPYNFVNIIVSWDR